jgi:hypothetical protein
MSCAGLWSLLPPAVCCSAGAAEAAARSAAASVGAARCVPRGRQLRIRHWPLVAADCGARRTEGAHLQFLLPQCRTLPQRCGEPVLHAARTGPVTNGTGPAACGSHWAGYKRHWFVRRNVDGAVLVGARLSLRSRTALCLL